MEARRQPAARTYVFEDYLESVHELRSKGSSYAEVAAFLAERLGQPITKGQVYRGYRLWLAARAGAAPGLSVPRLPQPSQPIPRRTGRIRPAAKVESPAQPVQPARSIRVSQPSLDDLPVEML